MMHEIRTPANEIRRQCHPRRAVRMPIGAVRMPYILPYPAALGKSYAAPPRFAHIITATNPPPGTRRPQRRRAGRTSAFPIKKKRGTKRGSGGAARRRRVSALLCARRRRCPQGGSLWARGCCRRAPSGARPASAAARGRSSAFSCCRMHAARGNTSNSCWRARGLRWRAARAPPCPAPPRPWYVPSDRSNCASVRPSRQRRRRSAVVWVFCARARLCAPWPAAAGARRAPDECSPPPPPSRNARGSAGPWLRTTTTR